MLPYQDELNEVQEKFRDSGFHFISERVPIEFQLYIKPSDPDFPFDLEKLELHITIPVCIVYRFGFQTKHSIFLKRKIILMNLVLFKF